MKHRGPQIPQSNRHRLFPVTEKLVNFNNQEVNLRNGSLNILRQLSAWMSPKSQTERNWHQLITETEKLYEENCPSAPNSGEFYPNLCFNGKTMILGAIDAARNSNP